MGESFTVLNVMGPYREPREPAFSFDYSVQRPNWPTPQGIRVKVALEEELEYLKTNVLNLEGGSPGQQLRIQQLLTRALADHKLRIANEEGMFNERLDVMIDPFSGPLEHLFPRLESWMKANRDTLKKEIQDTVGLSI